MRFTVYKHTTPNGKVYIGITSRKPEYRWNYGKGYKHNEYFYRAINKYGWDNIKHEILFTNLTKEQAEAKEIELIKHYDSTNRFKGYNIKSGGDTCEASEETRLKMSKAQKGKLKGLHIGGNSPRAKAINQYDLQGNFIKTWNASTDIQRELNIDYASVIKCCRKQRKSAGKYQWRYCGDDEINKYQSVNGKRRAVNQYDLDGNFIKHWDSIQQANEELEISKGSITKVCCGMLNHAKGYVWRYE
jgi:group I intron endonuclease